MARSIIGDYFYDNPVSNYGLIHGYVDYAALAKSFDCVLNNAIITVEPDYWRPVNGSDVDDEGNYREIFQWYIISQSGAQILQDFTDEIVYYNGKLDMYLWGVTHYGTSWDYVLTDIKIEK